MSLVTLIPGILCIIALIRGGTQGAFLNVVLPVLLLLPVNFYLKIAHLPALTFVDVALFPFGIGMILMDLPRWRFSRMDLYVFFFIFSCGYSEYLLYSEWRAMATAVIEGLVPYMAGKLLMNQPGMWEKTIKRFVTLVAIASFFAMYEYFFKANPYRLFWTHFYPGQWAPETAIRRGFGRVSGPYVQSELAGIILMAALLLTVWLKRRHYKEPQFRRLVAGVPKYAGVILFILTLALFMTQARGPWLGAIRRTIMILGFAVLVGIPAYQVVKEYMSGPRKDYGSERETAQYRAELIDNYVPRAKQGGAWGLGRVLPIIDGQTSVDNEYLLAWLIQGYVGLTTLLLLFIEAAITFFRLGLKTRSSRNRHLIFSLLGILLGMAFVLSTVWLGSQTFELLFLLVGWSQAIPSINIQEKPNAKEDVHPGWRESTAMRVYT